MIAIDLLCKYGIGYLSVSFSLLTFFTFGGAFEACTKPGFLDCGKSIFSVLDDVTRTNQDQQGL